MVQPDLAAVFAALPTAAAVFGVDAPHYTVLAASDALLAAAHRPRGEIVGRALAEAFPEAVPDDPGARSLASLRASIEAAVRTGVPQPMAQQRYDLRRPDGQWEERYWDAVNIPVRGPDGAVRYVLHQTEDVTARVVNEQARARAERRAERILEQISDAHITLDSEFRVVTVNAAAERLLGRSREELLGRTHWEAFPASVGSETERQYRRVQAERLEAHFTYHYVGEGYDVHLEIAAYPTDEGGVAVFWRDVTERRRAEVENAHLAALVRATGEAMFGVNAQGIIESWNPAAERLFGYAAAEIIGQHIACLAPPERLAEQRANFEAILGGRTVSHETVRVTRDGRLLDVILTTGPVVDAGGEPVGISAVIVDITERKRVEAALELERGRLADVFRQAPVAIAVLRGRVAADLVFELANPRYLEMIPAGREPVGRPLREALPEMGAVLLGALQDVLDTGRPFMATEYPLPLDRDGDGVPEEYFFNFIYHPLAEVDGTTAGVVGVGIEVTESVRARRDAERLQQAAEAARREAEAANRAKSEFLAVMSHELRTPLNAIGGYAELIEMGIRGPVTPQQREDLRRLQSSQRHLLGLINEVLNYARLETGSVHFDLADVRARDALASAEALVAPQAQGKALTLVVASCPPALVVRADAEKLRQVLVNLLSNAVKFTDRGGHVELTCAEAGDRVHIQVRDTGIGIAADQLERIFEPFVQVRADLTRTAEGTGLGLAISRDLARAMGGDLTAASEPGVGSTFTLTLPRA